MNSLNLAIENLTSPPVLAFVLGALAVVFRSDLRLPDPIHTWISTYLLLAIGLKGGHSLKDSDLASLTKPALLTIAFGIAIPIVIFFVTTKLLRLRSSDAGSIAAHYGSVSVVTFTAAMIFATEANFITEPFMTSLVAILEIPGIVVALVLASMKAEGVNWRTAVHEVLTGRSVLLLVGGLVIGAVSSANSFSRVEPFFVGMFSGLLTLFLLDMGETVATRFATSGRLPIRMVIFAIVSPIVFGTAGILAAHSIGLSIGGSAVFGIMAASASYIAAPAAVRIALPDADSGLSLGLALGVTFPFNLTIGIPLAFIFSR
ncbi:MAG: sodium-dependent bicarbonate transport family permease, partial [Actinobacteria bacterium]|nr:sodium-dependent bicarbonate transport family permease [Actinomycetota bacterium]